MTRAKKPDVNPAPTRTPGRETLARSKNKKGRRPEGRGSYQERDCTRRGDMVLDPFSGSGTTIMAAERIGRRAYTVEIDPHYVDVAIRRWQAFTRRDAVESETGSTFYQLAAERPCVSDERRDRSVRQRKTGSIGRSAEKDTQRVTRSLSNEELTRSDATKPVRLPRGATRGRAISRASRTD
jgi:DNA methylase